MSQHSLAKLLHDKSEKQNELLAKLLKEARDQAGLSETQAAAHVCRDQSFISRIESGAQKVTFIEVEQLAQGYGKSVNEFRTIERVEQQWRGYVIDPAALRAFTERLLSKRRKTRQKKRKAKS